MGKTKPFGIYMTKLGEVMKEKKVSLTDLSFIIYDQSGRKIPDSTISKYKASKRKTYLDTVEVFAKALGVRIEDLL